ncbi:short-chain fatty acid transporter [Nocardiopsis oceani]
MLVTVSEATSRLVRKILPSTFTFAILLTFLTLALGIVVERETPLAMLDHWFAGFWDFLEFSMQMTMIVITGYCIAVAPPVQKVISWVAKRITTNRQALYTTMTVAAVAAYISWGLGFILGPIFVRELRRHRQVDFPFLVAAAYGSAVAVLPAGLTVTVPLLINTPGHFLEEEIGLVPLTETIFHPTLFGTAALLLAATVLIFTAMQPKRMRGTSLESTAPEEVDSEQRAAAGAGTGTGDKQSLRSLGFGARVDHSRVVAYTLVLAGAIVSVQWFTERGFDLDLNFLNFAFLMLGIALHGSLAKYFEVVVDGVRSAAGIILQFHFYAGIMGMMVLSGLATTVAVALTSVSTPATAGFASFLSTGFLSIFIPSAGGGWGVQGDILVQLANEHDVAIPVVVAGYTLGDMWANLFNPFFALPALGVTGLGLRDLWGYCLVMFVAYFIIASIGIIVFPLLTGAV